jgi:hypothetical protein
MMLRAMSGFLVAALIALAARLTRSLAPSGAIAAVILGTLAVAAGWSWGVLLIVYFASSSALSHFGRASKEGRTASVVAKSGARDAAQVLANGATFAAAALFLSISYQPRRAMDSPRRRITGGVGGRHLGDRNRHPLRRQPALGPDLENGSGGNLGRGDVDWHVGDDWRRRLHRARHGGARVDMDRVSQRHDRRHCGRVDRLAARRHASIAALVRCVLS